MLFTSLFAGNYIIEKDLTTFSNVLILCPVKNINVIVLLLSCQGVGAMGYYDCSPVFESRDAKIVSIANSRYFSGFSKFFLFLKF